MTMKSVLKRVLKKIVPKESERSEFSMIIEKTIKVAGKVLKNYDLEKTIAGSFIRDTWLADKKEFDLFILFPENYSREELEKIGIKLGKKIIKNLNGKYEIAYAEHPYVRGKIGKFSIDIVPCYKVKSASQIKSAVDRTPFHNQYIKDNLSPEMANEVRLLKQFCKAMDIYGSDIRTMGFSGYLCELLIIHYKTFENLIKAASKWEFGEFIDIEKHCEIEKPQEYFKNQPLIVIDPTDPKRNVAAALSIENFEKFVVKCKEFLRKPSIKFFEIKKVPITKKALKINLKKRGTKLILIEFERPKVVDDILWSQMRKTANRIVNLLKENDFEVLDFAVWADDKKAYIIFEMKVWDLPILKKVIGPPLYSKKHSQQFIKKYGKRTYVENDRLIAEVKRKYRKCDRLLKDFLKDDAKLLIKRGVRSYVAKSISKRFKIFKKERDIEKIISKNIDLAIFLKKYFERNY
ncbi:MAG: CCA tRNA nucleotidyltransferase [Candidatus Aenigmatarchaeota archaeon]